MGLFDEVFSGLEAEAGQHAALYQEIGSLVSQSGGVSGLVQQFEQQDLGHLVAGNAAGGTITPISAAQIIQVIGQDRVTEIATRVGLSEQQVADGISRLLPMVISHLTSSSAAPASGGSQLEADALSLLKSKLFGS